MSVLMDISSKRASAYEYICLALAPRGLLGSRVCCFVSGSRRGDVVVSLVAVLYGRTMREDTVPDPTLRLLFEANDAQVDRDVTIVGKWIFASLRQTGRQTAIL